MIHTADWNRKMSFGSWWKDSVNVKVKKSLLANLESELRVKSKDLEFAFGLLIENRYHTETRKYVSKKRWKINENLKYCLRRAMASKHLPTTLSARIEAMRNEGVYFLDSELSEAVLSYDHYKVTDYN
jgi:hypothetical protein